VEKQNVTLSLPKDLLRKAKILAASQNKSLSYILRKSLEEIVAEADGYKKARTRQLRMLEKGLSLGTRGRIEKAREKLHERG
jgi:predicted transcriptional regulator